jgi:hypothetical protein
MSDRPVRDVYRELKDARFRLKFYSRRKKLLSRLSVAMDIVLALTAPTSTLTGFFIWDTTIGKWLWSILAMVAALVAVVKPFLRITAHIDDLNQLIGVYEVLDYELGELRIAISQDQGYDDAHRARFDEVREKKKDILSVSYEPDPGARVRKELLAEVDEELPEDAFYYPTPHGDGTAPEDLPL